jgi:ABC-2 type transport system permease protein
MFNVAIFGKTLRDSASMILVTASAIVGFVVLFCWAMSDMGAELMAFVSKFKFLKKIFEMGLGIDVTGDISISTLIAAAFAHGMVMLLAWSTMIAISSRVTAGEVERGTADTLLTLPVTRYTIYISTSLVWILSALLLGSCPVLGIWISSMVLDIKDSIDMTRYIAPGINFFLITLAVGSISAMISSILNRRGLAVAWVSGIAIVSVVLNFAEPFLESIKKIRFLGLLAYFRPVDIVRTGAWPTTSMIVLGTIAVFCWTVGLLVFSRKDIPTA